jgi:hypothetical protein
MENNEPKESPFACDMTALDGTQRQQWEVLLRQFSATKQEVRELSDGYAVRFQPESQAVQDLAESITYERLCCPFFDLELALEREGGPLWLRIRGRDGIKEFIRDEFSF